MLRKSSKSIINQNFVEHLPVAELHGKEMTPLTPKVLPQNTKVEFQTWRAAHPNI
jgi:hypothetical protein